jgi:hypothetical protein
MKTQNSVIEGSKHMAFIKMELYMATDGYMKRRHKKDERERERGVTGLQSFKHIGLNYFNHLTKLLPTSA